mmetsp:Transcript_18589/g.37894  ORF Transcript_18589/g.37894 Transcript_18589/m.37894 type:complete len:237 (-) Transcript_18589:112-822(-)
MPSITCAHCRTGSPIVQCSHCGQRRLTNCPNCSIPSVAHIRSDVIDMWERLYQDDESKDVQLVAKDGTVRAHGLILQQLSDAFKGMLSHPMAEGRTRTIKLETYSAVQLRFFFRLAYTGHVDASDWEGSSADKPPLDCLFGVAALAKEYAVPGFLSWMVEKVKAEVTSETFETITAFAIQHDIAPLRVCCVKFAESSSDVRKQFDKGSLKPEVAFELQAIWNAPAETRGQKRKAFS